jgi:hypothetical protein
LDSAQDGMKNPNLNVQMVGHNCCQNEKTIQKMPSPLSPCVFLVALLFAGEIAAACRMSMMMMMA